MNLSTLQFLEDLEHNNNREWFQNNRERYEDARADFKSFYERLLNEVMRFDEAVAKDREGSRKLFRINRDIRFSKDKSPYKSNFGGVIAPEGMKSGRALYYVHVQAGGRSGAAGGMHHPDSKTLLTVRKAVSGRLNEFKTVIEADEFKEQFGGLSGGDALKRVPRGFDPQDAAAVYLRLKSYTAWRSFTDDEVCGDDFLQKVLQAFKAVKKLNDFLNSTL
jgi:uncharacterized protein (TIGR02453 family)